jgi:hypothetical protein
MKTTDGEDPWASVSDPVPAVHSGSEAAPVEAASGEAASDDEATAGAAPGDRLPATDPGDRGPDDEPPYDDDRHDRPDPAERPADEARRLAEVVAGQLDEVRHRVVEPLLRKHPDVAAHLGAAGQELMAAYRALVADKERRWASRSAPAERVDLDDDHHHDRGDDHDDPGTRDDAPPRG